MPQHVGVRAVGSTHGKSGAWPVPPGPQRSGEEGCPPEILRSVPQPEAQAGQQAGLLQGSGTAHQPAGPQGRGCRSKAVCPGPTQVPGSPDAFSAQGPYPCHSPGFTLGVWQQAGVLSTVHLFLPKNEEVLKKCVQDYLARIEKEAQRYQALKAQASEKLQL